MNNFYIPGVGFAPINGLCSFTNRRTFICVYQDQFRSPRLYLVKLVKYRDCLGFKRSKYIPVEFVQLYLNEAIFSLDKYQTQLLSKYEESRKKNRLYLKNYKKVMNAGK